MRLIKNIIGDKIMNRSTSNPSGPSDPRFPIPSPAETIIIAMRLKNRNHPAVFKFDGIFRAARTITVYITAFFIIPIYNNILVYHLLL